MTHANEYTLVEKPILDRLKAHGYRTIHPDEHPILRPRENEVLFKPLLVAALVRINGIPKDTAEAIFNDLAGLSDNQKWLEILRGHYSRKIPGEETHRTIRVIDFDHPKNNDFACTHQLRVRGEVVRKPDVVVYVNGIPLVVIEAKSPLNPSQNAFDAIDQIRSAEREIPRLFHSNLFNIATNDLTCLYGATGAPHEHWARWRDPWPRKAEDFTDETEKGLYALLEPSRLLDILAHFVVFETREGKTLKKLCRYQQFRAVNKMVQRVVDNQHRAGLIWHTQGSGKSLTMVFAALKLKFHRGVESERLKNPNLLVITDRIDLHNQIAATFQACGLPNPIPAESIDQLRQVVTGSVSGRTIISTIFKFHWDDPRLHSDVHKHRRDALRDLAIPGSENWILMVDEAHRTQEKDLGAYLRGILPHAVRFGFTGTPVKKGDKDTFQNFGAKGETYLDKYGIDDAVADGATVPIYYQGRMTEWHLHDKEIDVLFDQWFANEPPDKVEELKKRGVTRGDLARFGPRIDLIAVDIWAHFRAHVAPDGFKAQICAIDRRACVAYKMAIDRVIAESLMATGKLSEDEGAWGDNHNGQIGSGVADQGLHPVPVRVTGLSDIKTVAAGNWHNLALSQDGKVWAWGWNEFGQLGDGTTIERHSPVRVTGLPPIVALAAGFGHSLALARDGTLWAWGWNGFGQIGDGTTTNWYSPIRVTGIEGVVALAAGAYSNLVQVRDGTLWAWGDNGAGQLGLAGATQRAIPGLVEGLSDVVQLAAGWEHNLARTSDGAVWAWGGNGYGQLGYNSLISNYSHPVRVASLKPATTVSAGHLFSLALVAGQVWAWGQNNHGQLGQGTTDIYVHGTPVVIPGLPAIQGVSAGMGHSLALARDGRVWAWGSNLNGQLGDNSTTDRWGPVQVTGLDSVVAVAAGHYHSLALKQDGSLWAWGYNADGRLGDGTQIQRLVPIQVTGLGPVQRIAAGVGADHSLAMTQDGQAWSWGNNSFGQLGLGETDSKAHPIPQAIPNLTKVTNFSGGWKSTLAVRQDGTVWACGNNDSGELGDGTFAAHATPVLAENTTLDGILDLDLATPNDIPQGSLPSFLMDTVKIGNLASVVLSVRVNLAPLTPGGLAAALPNSYQSMNMYVAANAPPGAQTPVCMPQTALSDPSWWVWEKANTGGGSALVWPIGAFKSNVPDDYNIPTELIVNCDLRGQTDTAIYLGYGTSADEMLNVWRVREMYRVPAP